MAPPKKTKASPGYKGVRVRPWSRWSAELQHESVRYYLGTFDTADLGAWAYDVAEWQLGVPREELNFPDITSLQDDLRRSPDEELGEDPVGEEEGGVGVGD
ncbi:Ethylene-responsive transcription factor CRF1 [Hordeum vulgare]|nr:Ethylene-responsive transcription factor CRF1 [Hordeum vulgare]